jgi:hypothetical protein
MSNNAAPNDKVSELQNGYLIEKFLHGLDGSGFGS